MNPFIASAFKGVRLTPDDLATGIILAVLMLVSCRMCGISMKYIRFTLRNAFYRLQRILKMHFQNRKRKDR